MFARSCTRRDAKGVRTRNSIQSSNSPHNIHSTTPESVMMCKIHDTIQVSPFESSITAQFATQMSSLLVGCLLPDSNRLPFSSCRTVESHFVSLCKVEDSPASEVTNSIRLVIHHFVEDLNALFLWTMGHLTNTGGLRCCSSAKSTPRYLEAALEDQDTSKFSRVKFCLTTLLIDMWLSLLSSGIYKRKRDTFLARTS